MCCLSKKKKGRTLPIRKQILYFEIIYKINFVFTRKQNSKFTTWHYFEVKQKVTTRNTTCYEIKYAYLLLVLILSKVIDTPGLQYQIILKYNWDSFEKVPNYFKKFLVFYFLLSQQLKSILMYNFFFFENRRYSR